MLASCDQLFGALDRCGAERLQYCGLVRAGSLLGRVWGLEVLRVSYHGDIVTNNT